jgi:hypothetical protein
MPNTANYLWPTPADTDLVKNGADAIRDLGDAADTTVKSVADGRGLIHINSTSFTSQSAVSAATNTFSSTYTDYFIKVNVTLSNSTTLRFRMRAAGTDATGSNYTTQYLYGNGATAGAGNTTETGGYLNVTDASGRCVVDFIVYNPNLAVATFTNSKFTNSTMGVGSCGVQHSLTTAYDSITIYPGAGTITGDMTIFGIKK